MKKVYKYLMNLMLLLVLVVFKMEVNAAGQFLENNKNSVVQVVLSYTTEDGIRYILQSGSGVVINNNTVLTNYHLVHLDENNLKKAAELVGANEEKEFSQDSISVAIVKKDDILIYGEITQESEEKDFAILTLQETTNRSPAILGSSSMVVIAENVMAIGYPTTKPFSKEGAQWFTDTDVNLITGVVSEIVDGSIKVSGIISAGNSGGPLVNTDTGEIIGLLKYNKEDSKKECFQVIPIDDIKNPYLEGTTYSDRIRISDEEFIFEII